MTVFFRKKFTKSYVTLKNNLCTCRGFNSDAIDLPHSKFELLNPNFLIWCHLFGLQPEEKWLRAFFDRVLPDRSWDMPVERELPSKIGWCNEELAGHNFNLRAKSSWEDFLYLVNILLGGFCSKVKIAAN